MEAIADEIEARLRIIRSRIEAAALRVGREPGPIDIVAVTKFHPAELVEAAIMAGLTRFGESRVQEAEAKFAGISLQSRGGSLEMLGHLQKNKVVKALRIFDRIQSIDSCELLEVIITKAQSLGRHVDNPLEILFELHTAEDSKGGFEDEADVHKACRIIERHLMESAPSILPCGIMTMGPQTTEISASRSAFRRARELFLDIMQTYNFPNFSVLSMGMSIDFEVAVEEGSTLVRIGTALFGERQG